MIYQSKTENNYRKTIKKQRKTIKTRERRRNKGGRSGGMRSFRRGLHGKTRIGLKTEREREIGEDRRIREIPRNPRLKPGKNGFHLHLIPAELCDKFVQAVEFQFGTGAAYKGDTHRAVIDEFIEMEDMDFDTAVGAIV